MVSLVNFGNFDVIGGKNVSTGISSGLDTKSIVEGLTEAKRFPINELEDKVKKNTDKISAYSEMTNFLNAFKESAGTLKQSTMFEDATKDAFKKRTVFLNSNDGSVASNYLGVAASSDAVIGKYSIKIDNLAVAKNQISDGFADKTSSVTEASGGATSNMFKAGIFQINGVDIELFEGDNLIEIESHINAVKGLTNVQAEIIKVSDSDYRLILKSMETGIDNAFTITDIDGKLDDINFTVTSAEDAQIDFNGITNITRSKNVIDDIVDGITFTLYQETQGAAEMTAEIDENSAEAIALIRKFVGAYNDFKLFAAKQQEKDEISGKYKETAILGNDSILVRALDEMFFQLSSDVTGADDNYSNLSDIGITFGDYLGDEENLATKNIMVLDDVALQNALNADWEKVRKIFEFDFNASSDKVMVGSRGNQISVNSFSIDIDTSRSEGDEVRITYNNGTSDVTINPTWESSTSGGKIIGLEGTVIEGMVIYYSGDGTDVITVNMTHGIGDKVYNVLDDFTNATDGLIMEGVNSLSSQTSDANDEIAKLEDDLNKYRDRLLVEYSAIETAIAKVNSVLQFLDAETKAREAN